MDKAGIKERKLGALEKMAKKLVDEDNFNLQDRLDDVVPVQKGEDINFDKELNKQLRSQRTEDFNKELDFMWSILADNPELQKDPRIIEGLQEREKNFNEYNTLSEDIDEDYLKNKKESKFKFDQDI